MKVAYLGFDKCSLKTQPALAQVFQDIDYYLLEINKEVLSIDLASLPIITDHLCIPSNVVYQTEQHKSKLKTIKSELFALNKKIYNGIKKNDSIEITSSQDVENRLFDLNKVSQIKYNKIVKKHTIGLSDKSEGIDYDYIIIQNHKFIADLILKNDQNIIKNNIRQNYVLLNIEYSLLPEVKKASVENDFIYIENSSIKTFIDNYFICSLTQNSLSVRFLIPFDQSSSQEFINFCVDRVKSIFSEKYRAFKILNFNKTSIEIIDEFNLNKIGLRHPKNTAIFPTFAFWSQGKINYYIQNVFFVKNKKNKILFSTGKDEL